MNDGIKQRLIGAIVVMTALGVLLVPSLFDERARRVDLRPQVPPTPDTLPEPITWVEPQAVFSEEDFAPPEQSKLVDTPVSEEDVAASPVIDESGNVNAWALQVASFQSPERSAALVDALRADDYSAYEKSSRAVNGEAVYRVYVGPKLNKDDLLAAKAALDKRLGTQAFIVRYRPATALGE